MEARDVGKFIRPRRLNVKDTTTSKVDAGMDKYVLV